MPTQVTFHTELSRDAFRVLRDELNAMIEQSPSTSAAPLSTPATSDQFTSAAGDLYRRLNPNLQALLRFLVDHYEDRKFTWEEVARDMGREPGTVKSWHRSLSKPLNRLVRNQPSVPPLLAGSWDGLRNQYSVSPEWRKALRGV